MSTKGAAPGYKAGSDSSSEASTGARRDFLSTTVKALGVFCIGATAYPVYRFLDSPAADAQSGGAADKISLKEAVNLGLGEAMLFSFNRAPAILIRHPDDSWVCMSAVCTHLGCTVRFNRENRSLVCACHEGVFDSLTGDPVAGPPKEPLASYRVEVMENEVIVARR